MDRNAALATGASGLVASTLGYAAMLAAAALLPAWRRDLLHRAWLHACGVALLQVALDFLWDRTEKSMPPTPRLCLLNLDVFLMQVTACSSLAPAWLAHRRLARVFEPPPERCALKCCAMAWVPPLASQAALHAYRAATAAPARGVFAALFVAPVAASFCGSVALYAHALLSACRGGARHGRTGARHVVRLAALAFVFLLMSGAHSSAFLVLSLFSKDFGLDADAFGDAFRVVVSFRVFVFSFILVFGIKKTRKMWIDWYRNRKQSNYSATPYGEIKNKSSSLSTKNSCVVVSEIVKCETDSAGIQKKENRN